MACVLLRGGQVLDLQQDSLLLQPRCAVAQRRPLLAAALAAALAVIGGETGVIAVTMETLLTVAFSLQT